MKARNLYFTKFSEAEREISSLKDKKIQTYGKWSYYQILTHLADGLEYTLKGENPKWYFPVIIQNTIGKLMLNRILRQKSMPPGLPNLIKKNTVIYGDEKEAYKRLIKVMEEFKSFSGEFKPHPVFGKMTKGEWYLLHTCHFANHLSYIK
ncbi:MAG: DUF1569 domain-containing protein [Leptospiraceae bacterium]|nr:DUF1569 domain-containing protein [Leptospiraceae bacterium]